MEARETSGWDWEAAALAGLVQDKALHTLARVEPLGRDRWHAQIWATPQVIV